MSVASSQRLRTESKLSSINTELFKIQLDLSLADPPDSVAPSAHANKQPQNVGCLVV